MRAFSFRKMVCLQAIFLLELAAQDLWDLQDLLKHNAGGH